MKLSTPVDYERWPGMPRPIVPQQPRSLESRRYPWPCKTIEDVRKELAKCPSWAHGPFAVVFEGMLLGWPEAHELVRKADQQAIPAEAPKTKTSTCLRAKCRMRVR